MHVHVSIYKKHTNIYTYIFSRKMKEHTQVSNFTGAFSINIHLHSFRFQNQNFAFKKI